MTWERGRSEVQRLIDAGELDTVVASGEVASRLLDDAERHIAFAAKGVADDPAGALQLGYDAVRKSSAALLAVQGLRATTRGGHVAVLDAVRAQFNDRGGVQVFGRLHRLRRRRNSTEYPDLDSPGVTGDDARRAVDTAREVLRATRQLISTGKLDRFA